MFLLVVRLDGKLNNKRYQRRALCFYILHCDCVCVCSVVESSGRWQVWVGEERSYTNKDSPHRVCVLEVQCHIVQSLCTVYVHCKKIKKIRSSQ